MLETELGYTYSPSKISKNVTKTLQRSLCQKGFYFGVLRTG